MWIDDRIISNSFMPMAVDLWQPEDILVVGGNSNDLEKETYFDRCREDGVPLLKRSGGGGTVLLHPGCLIVSAGLWVKSLYRNDYFFREINQALIALLSDLNPKFLKLYQDGISDIVFEGKKVAGTSLFRSRNYLLYQASVLMDTGLDLVETYLAHPSKEPGYREGKSHRDFLTCLRAIDSDFEIEDPRGLKAQFEELLRASLRDELIEPQEDQIPHLLKKVKPLHI